jgi:large conductance mechanosensitive channel
MGLLKEFQEFAFKGNLIDMAVGIIMGAAFGPIIASLVGDVIMPPIGMAMNGVDFSSMAIPLGTAADGKVVGIGYGKLINALINFLITAAAIFMLVKFVNTAKKRMEKEAAAAPPPPPPRQEVLLEEIRNALMKR